MRSSLNNSNIREGYPSFPGTLPILRGPPTHKIGIQGKISRGIFGSAFALLGPGSHAPTLPSPLFSRPCPPSGSVRRTSAGHRTFHCRNGRCFAKLLKLQAKSVRLSSGHYTIVTDVIIHIFQGLTQSVRCPLPGPYKGAGSRRTDGGPERADNGRVPMGLETGNPHPLLEYGR